LVASDNSKLKRVDLGSFSSIHAIERGVTMKFATTLKLITSAASLVMSFAVPLDAAAQTPAKTVVLVHGAFADGSSWSRVIPILEKAGLKVVAVQNPLDSLEDDVAVTNRALDLAEGPVVLVGHSWGGVVITEAGLHEKVKALVYVAAYAPDVGQSLVDTVKNYPDPPGQAFFVKDSKGFFKISDQGIFKHFAADLPREDQEVVAATQGAFSSTAIVEPVTKAAWHKVPTFVVVTANDTIFQPQIQRDQVKRMHAKSVEVASSHVAMLSHPEVVAKMIIEAAQ
jgi:pimeloyl-ACP methyl ester carboxylesterase